MAVNLQHPLQEGGKNWGDRHSRQVIDNLGKPLLVEEVQDAGLCFSDGSLHSCRIDWGDVGWAEAGMGETNSAIDSELVT